MNDHLVTSLDELLARYGEPRPNSLVKEIDHVSDEYRAFIDASPFMAIATVGEEGLDCSPRGDDPRVVDVVNPKLIRIPDRKGNNRLDSLRNLVADPRVALLFLIPGVTETMRVSGTARVSVDPELLERYTVEGSTPRTVIEIVPQRVYFQCSRATMRSGLWDSGRHRDRGSLPTCGQMLAAISDGAVDATEYDDGLEERLRDGLY